MKRVLLLLMVSVIALLSAPHLVEPNNKRSLSEWGVQDSKSYAQDQLYQWQRKQWSCLNRLWGKESAWNPKAYNTIKVSGRNAGGIPQLLGLDPATQPTRQIERGLDYIYNRYGTPCKAWEFFKRKGWH
jgi:hypothetical protein